MYLVLSPGGVGAIYKIAGCVSAIPNFDDIQEVSGSSAGAIVGFVICMGFQPNQIKEILFNCDLTLLKKFDVKGLLKNFGLSTWGSVRKNFVELVGCDPTFKELPKKLYISAYCVNTSRVVYFSRDTHPGMKVIDAVCMSASIPIILESLIYEGHRYIDAAICEKIPMDPFVHIKKEDVLLIDCMNSDISYDKVTTFQSFLINLSGILLKNRQCVDINCKRINLDIPFDTLVNFNISHEQKSKLFVDGFLMYMNNNNESV